jgi:TonB family protein
MTSLASPDLTRALCLFGLLLSTMQQHAIAQSPRIEVARTGQCPDFPGWPTLASQESNLEVRFEVLSSSQLESVEIVTSSSDPKFDEAVVGVLRNCTFIARMAGGQPRTGFGTIVIGPNTGGVKSIKFQAMLIPAKSCIPQSRDYPEKSRLAKEQGASLVRIFVSDKGQAISSQTVKSSGFPALDEVSNRKLSQCNFLPAITTDGLHIASSVEVEYVWKLE